MKSYLSVTRLVALAAALLSTTLATTLPASASELKINGSFEAVEVQTVTPPMMHVELEGAGCASHLGRFFLAADAVVFLPTAFGKGTFEINAGHGNRLTGNAVGQGFPSPASDLVPVEETYTITGGTGRFHGASGVLHVHRVIDRLTKVSSAVIAGTIILPERPKCQGRR